MEPRQVIPGNQANDQLLYFTSSSLTDDDRYLVFISDRSGHPNLFFTDLHTSQITQLTFNSSGYLKSYVYFCGLPYQGLGKASISLDSARGIAYFIQGKQICCVDLRGSTRILNELPDNQVTAFTHVSTDGKRLCVPTTDARALDDDRPVRGSANKPDYDIDKRIQEERLNSFIHIYDTQSGAELHREKVECAWITHVQFSPINSDWILYNHEWPSDCGIRRMWLWDGNQHFRLREEGEKRNRLDWVCHEVWTKDGNSVIYHGNYHQGPYFLGKVAIHDRKNCEIPLPDGFDQYGHFNLLNENVLVSDGYFKQGQSNGSVGEWLSLQKVSWNSKLIDWIPLCRHGSNWDSQDSHPHPIFNHKGTEVFFTSNKNGFRSVYQVDISGLISC